MGKRNKLLKIVIPAVLIIAILIFLILSTDFNIIRNPLLKCGGIYITADTYKMEVYDCAQSLKDETFGTDTTTDKYATYSQAFWTAPIEGKMPVEIVKERAMESIKYYAYFTAECNKNGFKFEGTELQAFRSLMETQFMDLDTQREFGVDEDGYIAYLADKEKFEKFNDIEIARIEAANQNDIQSKYDEMKKDQPDKDITMDEARFAVQTDIYNNKIDSIIKADPGLFKVDILDQKAYDSIGLPGIFVF